MLTERQEMAGEAAKLVIEPDSLCLCFREGISLRRVEKICDSVKELTANLTSMVSNTTYFCNVIKTHFLGLENSSDTRRGRWNCTHTPEQTLT